MRYILLLIFLIILNLSKAATVSGKISPFEKGNYLTLTLLNYDTRKDSVVVKKQLNEEGNFSISLIITEPALYSLGFEGKPALALLVVKPENNIFLEIRNEIVICSGSKATSMLIDYETERKKIFKSIVQPVKDSATLDNAKGEEYWNNKETESIILYKSKLSEWVIQSSFINSLGAIHHSLRWNADSDLALMDSMVNYYKQNYPDYLLTRQLENKVRRVKLIAIGQKAPGFSSRLSDSSKFSFNGQQGKYILIDFWASWCAPCRKESPTLVKAYNKYKDQGFDIISISVDENYMKWTTAIIKDHYTWTNVSDLNGWNSPAAVLYSVSAIPSNFLLDQEGRIIAKNLRGKDLETMLEKLMKK